MFKIDGLFVLKDSANVFCGDQFKVQEGLLCPFNILNKTMPSLFLNWFCALLFQDSKRTVHQSTTKRIQVHYNVFSKKKNKNIRGI